MSTVKGFRSWLGISVSQKSNDVVLVFVKVGLLRYSETHLSVLKIHPVGTYMLIISTSSF